MTKNGFQQTRLIQKLEIMSVTLNKAFRTLTWGFRPTSQDFFKQKLNRIRNIWLNVKSPRKVEYLLIRFHISGFMQILNESNFWNTQIRKRKIEQICNYEIMKLFQFYPENIFLGLLSFRFLCFFKVKNFKK